VTVKKSAVTAVRKLERSQLDPKTVQQELMGDDLDLESMVVYLRSKIKFDAAESVLDVQISRTIDGASTAVFTIDDDQNSLLNSGTLSSALDVQLNGLWFRLVKVERVAGERTLTLTFEDREIAILRSYPKSNAPHHGVKFANRSKTTRAEFILNLIREVKEFHIPVVIPELHKVQPIQKATDMPGYAGLPGGVTATPGIPTSIPQHQYNPNDNLNPRTTTPGSPTYVLPVKGVGATSEQIKNANAIIDTGHSMGARRKVIVCAIMTAITESTLHNYAGGDLDSVGLFQQRASWGSYQDRHDPATSAKLFFIQAMKLDAAEPNYDYWALCADVQRPREDLRTRYGLYRQEAEKFVTTYGIAGGDMEGSITGVNNIAGNAFQDTSSDFFFYRGIPQQSGKVWKREDNWTCIQRLAGDVQWRAFFVSGVFYLISEEDLFKTQPIMIIDETSPGIDGIGFDYDTGKKSATCDIPMQVGTWIAPPGAVVAIQHMGPVSGRWIVTDFSRSIFNPQADVSLAKPQPVLPEPLTDPEGVTSLPTWAQGSGTHLPGDPPAGAQFGGIEGATGDRGAIITVLDAALAEQARQRYMYLQSRPMPASLFSAQAHAGIDCSTFATLVYKEANLPDPNDENYNGAGNTGTLINHNRRVVVPSPGDFVFYGGTVAYPGHVMIYYGNNQVVGIGSDTGINKVPMNYRSDLIGYASAFPPGV
jgi:hypothetical protein